MTSSAPKKDGETVYLENNIWTYCGKDDGITYEFNVEKRAWFPRITAKILETQQAIYKVEGIPVEKPSIKRKREKELAQEKKAKIERPKKNRGIYVSGLPLDCTSEEIGEYFKKGGVFLLDPLTSLPRIKMYSDESGKFKGDALIVYLREESVSLACQLLDDTHFRDSTKETIKVQPAVFKSEPPPDAQEEYTAEEKKAIAKAAQKMKKQLEWFEEEEIVQQKNWKCVILKHMFTIEQLEAQPTLLLDLKQDVRSECGKLGEVTSVILYDLEEEGIISVKFKSPQAARLCVNLMNGRFYDKRVIEATLSSGKEKFKKSKAGNEEEERKRHEDYGEWLDSQDV